MTATESKNFLQYIWQDLILFKRDFVWISDLSVQDCADKLQNLSYQKRGFWEGQGKLSPFVARDGSMYRFQIDFQGPAENLHLARMKGTIENDDAGRTLVKGSAAFVWQLWSVVFVVYGLLFLVGLFANFSAIVWLFSIPWTVGWIFLVWWAMYRDRNLLLEIVESAVTNTTKE